MKELSIEEKAKRYDGLIERLKDLKFAYRFSPLSDTIEDTFPELKESEDERIRKDIISHFAKGIEGSSFDEVIEKYKIWIAWLEKQGEQKPIDVRTTGYWHVEDVEQKPAWSEEEEVKINRIVACLENLNVADNDILLKDVDWLKSLKDRVQPQPKQEWSEEDEKIINDLLWIIEAYRKNGFNETHKYKADKSENWLIALEDRYTWKPSDEQMRVLDLAIRCGIYRGTTEENTLVSLFNDLKKLK